MKKAFNTTIYFITFTLSLMLTLLIGTNSINAQAVDLSSCIKNTNNETVVLVLNNNSNGEISARNNKNNNIFTNSSPLILSYQPTNNLFKNNRLQANGYFICNLSTDKRKIHQIRAP